MKEFTSEELASFNGKDGKPVYVAFQGRVFDVTRSRLCPRAPHETAFLGRTWPGRSLQRLMAGGPGALSQVGVLREGRRRVETPSFVLQNLLDRFPFAKRHPHPMVVHFPIALLMTASLFILLHLFFRTPSFELTASTFSFWNHCHPFAVFTVF